MDPIFVDTAKYPEQCYCGHLHERHMYSEGPVGGWQPGDPEPELKFERCAGMSPLHKGKEQTCACPEFRQFPFGYYILLMTGVVYEAVGLAFNHEDRALEVEYQSVSLNERWHRPVHGKNQEGFFDPGKDGRSRFQHVDAPEKP